MRPGLRRSRYLPALVAIALWACGGEPASQDASPADTLSDTLTNLEQQAFAVDPLRYFEMQNGRLDTVAMQDRRADAAWQVQAVNYAEGYIALTYATWYSGPDSVALLAADGQPRLVDNLGNVYRGLAVPANPRFKVETGTTAVGVFVFEPGIVTEADSLTLYVNDSTPPVLRVGPFGVHHDATGSLSPTGDRDARDVELQAGD